MTADEIARVAEGQPHRIEVVMVIEWHDWRFYGDGWRWQEPPSGRAPSWDDLVRVPFQEKHCMTCLFTGEPDAMVGPCHERWSDMTGYPSSSGIDGEVYYPPLAVRDHLLKERDNGD